MEACAHCGATVTPGATDCAACGTLVRPELRTPDPGSGKALDPSLGRIANLFEGNYGLVETYWLYGVVGGIVVGIVLGAVIGLSESLLVSLLALAALWAWQTLVCVAIWNAARKYPGSKVWSVLARVSAVIGMLRLIKDTSQLLGLTS